MALNDDTTPTPAASSKGKIAGKPLAPKGATASAVRRADPHIAITPQPSTTDRGLQRVASLALPSFGDTQARILTFNLDKIGQATYDKMETDAMVALASELKTHTIVTQDFTVRHADKEVAALCDAVLRPHWSAYVRNFIRVAAARGWSPVEHVWGFGNVEVLVDSNGEDTDYPDSQLDDDGRLHILRQAWTIDKVKLIQPQNVLGVLIDGNENFCGYRLISPAQAELTVEDGSVFHMAHNARFGNYFGEAEFRRAYEPWYNRNLVSALYLRYLTRFATPIPMVKYPQGTVDGTGTDYSVIAGQIVDQMLTQDLPRFTVPLPNDATAPAWEIGFLNPSIGTNEGRQFVEALQYFNSQILRSLLMPDSVATTQGLSANRSIGQVHLDSFFAACDGYTEELANYINQQLLPTITLYNFGPDMQPPRIDIAPLTNAKRSMVEQLLQMAFRSAGGAMPGVDYKAMMETAGVPTMSGTSAAVVNQPTNPEAGTDAVTAAEEREYISVLKGVTQRLRLEAMVRDGE